MKQITSKSKFLIIHFFEELFQLIQLAGSVCTSVDSDQNEIGVLLPEGATTQRISDEGYYDDFKAKFGETPVPEGASDNLIILGENGAACITLGNKTCTITRTVTDKGRGFSAVFADLPEATAEEDSKPANENDGEPTEEA